MRNGVSYGECPIKGAIKDSLNADTVGELYAGDIWHRSVESCAAKAFELGKQLGQNR